MIDDADRLYERLLVLRCQAGDEVAFAELIKRYQPRLQYYVRKLLFGLREPEDVLQDVWLDVFRSIARLIDADAFRAWLYQVARARALKEFRKRRLSFEPLGADEPAELGEDIELFAADDAQSVHAAPNRNSLWGGLKLFSSTSESCNLFSIFHRMGFPRRIE